MEGILMSTAADTRLLVETVEGVTVVNFTDASLTSDEVIQQLEEQLEALFDQFGGTRLVLNFDDVRYMSSAVLAVLLKGARRVGAMGGQLKLCGLSPALKEAFRASGLDRVFEIHESESSALDSF
jgi:anti-sigma B factor antagonist